ncbi:hypothetical protein UlMin_026339 [Ulmus minor]
MDPSEEKGHNLRLFGVNIMREVESMQRSLSSDHDQSITKSPSLDNLRQVGAVDHDHDHDSGYHSDGVIHDKKRKAAHERKKGLPWTIEEHRSFLGGLNALGKGDWKGISKDYVRTRSPTQVASHAQKYFLRLNNQANNKKKRRSSLFDMPNKRHGSPVSTLDKAIENSSKDSSQELERKNISSTWSQERVEQPNQFVNGFSNLILDNYPHSPDSARFQYNQQIPYMVEIPGNSQFVPVMNIARPRYYPNTAYQNINVANCVPFFLHPSGIPPPKIHPRSPTYSERDELELKI